MDNLTHTLFAATLARTPLGRGGRGTTSALILASNAPDLDIIATAGGALKYLEWHRGPTHGPLGMVGLGLTAASLVWAGGRLLDRRRSAQHASYLRLAAASVVGVLLHALMDLPTSYGSRLLSPFDWHWYAVDLLPIIDIYLLTALAAGLVVGAGSEAARRRNAAIVLVFMAANYVVRGVAHDRALKLAPRAFGASLPERCGPPARPMPIVDRWPLSPSPIPKIGDSDSCLVEIAALPSFATPFHWRLIAHLSGSYEMTDVNVLGSGLRAIRSNQEAVSRVRVSWPNHWTPAVFSAARTEVGQVFLGFSRFPAVRTFVDGDGVTTVRWVETRFIRGPLVGNQQNTRAGFFTATVRIDATGRILEERLGP